MSYDEFFRSLTGHTPFDYQRRLALREDWPTLIDIPTGLGKTAAIVVAWLWKRRAQPEHCPRRLIYCLPMRVLVEQTEASAREWCNRAASEVGATIPVYKLMGGDRDDAWSSRPDEPAILVGTQDMLLSRALNRGYAMSRYRWPMSFGLLHSDAIWVYDETQIMGVGLETSAQLEGLRAKLGTSVETRSIWMSATLGRERLATVDHELPTEDDALLTLNAADRGQQEVRDRTEASKPIDILADVRLDDLKQLEDYIEGLAQAILQAHRDRGRLTLVLLNRVDRAQALFERLARDLEAGTELSLIHSRFRPADRRRQEGVLLDAENIETDRVVVATQAVEAGVDASSHTLFTELAPWPSLVQRLGRLNRYGEDSHALARWIDIDTDPNAASAPATKQAKARSLPYRRKELDVARADLLGLRDAGPSALRAVEAGPEVEIRPILRRRDLMDLFDTTPDLAGNDLDVAQFIRDDQDTDVQIYWRKFEETDNHTPPASAPQPHRDELCRVTIAAAATFFQKARARARNKRTGGARETATRLEPWWWDPLEARWVRGAAARPGRVFLLHIDGGGYSEELGWTGNPRHQPVPIEPSAEKAPAQSDDSNRADPQSHSGNWVPLADHLRHVQAETRALTERLNHIPPDLAEVLETAAGWHDVGKTHEWFQRTLLEPASDPPAGDGPWAKSDHSRFLDVNVARHEGRKQFRHELASALGWLAHSRDNAEPDERDTQIDERRDLIAYLIAAHHGKVRLSIRSLPEENGKPGAPDVLFARGVFHGDVLRGAVLPSGELLPDLALDLDYMRMGRGSWLERTLRLRDAPHLGPFRLAFLEAVLRASDQRASAAERTNQAPSGGDR